MVRYKTGVTPFLKKSYLYQLEFYDDVVYDGETTIIYLDYKDPNNHVKYFPFKCLKGHDVVIEVIK